MFQKFWKRLNKWNAGLCVLCCLSTRQPCPPQQGASLSGRLGVVRGLCGRIVELTWKGKHLLWCFGVRHHGGVVAAAGGME